MRVKVEGVRLILGRIARDGLAAKTLTDVIVNNAIKRIDQKRNTLAMLHTVREVTLFWGEFQPHFAPHPPSIFDAATDLFG